MSEVTESNKMGDKKSGAKGVIVRLLREHLFGISILACAAIAFAFPSAFTEWGCRTVAWQGLLRSAFLEAQSQRSSPMCFLSGWTSPARFSQTSGADINQTTNDVWLLFLEREIMLYYPANG